MAANQEMGRQALGMFGIPLTQEMFDAMAVAGEGEDSTDNVPLNDYAQI